jgi:hypothetical protein
VIDGKVQRPADLNRYALHILKTLGSGRTGEPSSPKTELVEALGRTLCSLSKNVQVALEFYYRAKLSPHDAIAKAGISLHEFKEARSRLWRVAVIETVPHQ